MTQPIDPKILRVVGIQQGRLLLCLTFTYVLGEGAILFKDEWWLFFFLLAVWLGICFWGSIRFLGWILQPIELLAKDPP